MAYNTQDWFEMTGGATCRSGEGVRPAVNPKTGQALRPFAKPGGGGATTKAAKRGGGKVAAKPAKHRSTTPARPVEMSWMIQAGWSPQRIKRAIELGLTPVRSFSFACRQWGRDEAFWALRHGLVTGGTYSGAG